MSAGAIVTPEAVRLEFEAAGLASRTLSRLIDVFVVLVGVYALLFVLAPVLIVTESGVLAAVVSAVLVFLALFGYPAIAETWWRGRTVGKAALGLRVVTVEGGPVGFRHAAIRSMFQLLDFVLVPGGAVAVVSGFTTRRCQRVGDLVAGTFVVRERQGGRDVGSVPFPPPWGYEGYVRTLDPSLLTPADHRTIRSFLLRANELTPDARVGVALALATPLAQRMAHVPPPGVTPELFLYCLAAAYQLRFGGTIGMAGPQPPPPPPAGSPRPTLPPPPPPPLPPPPPSGRR